MAKQRMPSCETARKCVSRVVGCGAWLGGAKYSGSVLLGVCEMWWRVSVRSVGSAAESVSCRAEAGAGIALENCNLW